MKIGQVVDLLKVEFPALSISKVRYLEGEGLISPHRVGNGYRRYSQADLERLRYALAVQRDEYLPLHVIRERLARLDADVEAPAPQPVARVVARDGRIVDDGPMDLEALLAHSGARRGRTHQSRCSWTLQSAEPQDRASGHGDHPQGSAPAQPARGARLS